MRPGDNVSFAEALQQARLDNNLKQRTLAELLRIPWRTLGSWENGHRVPPIGTILRLSRLLHTDLLTPCIAADARQRYKKAADADLEYLREQVLGDRSPVHRNQDPPALVAASRERRSGEAGAPTEVGAEESLQARRGEDPIQHAPVEQLFLILGKLQRNPHLIPITAEFLQALEGEDHS